MANGETPPLISIATGTTNASGQFTVTKSILADLPSSYRDDDGNVAIEVHAQAAGQLALFHAQSRPGERTDIAADFGSQLFTQAVKATAGAVTRESLVSELSTAAAVGAPKAAPTVAESTAVETDTADAAVDAAADAASEAPLAVQELPLTPAVDSAPPPCHWLATSTYKKNVTEYHARVVGAKAAPATLTEVSNTNHDVGIAVKLSGASGWSQSGTSSVGKSDENSASTAATGLAKTWANGVNYRQWGWTCGGSMWRTSGLYSLLKKSKALSRPTYTNCVSYGSSVSQWTKKSGSSWTSGGGVELGGILDLSAKAEWGKDVTVSWTHAHPELTVKYCGSTSSGPASSPLVETHQS